MYNDMYIRGDIRYEIFQCLEITPEIFIFRRRAEERN